MNIFMKSSFFDMFAMVFTGKGFTFFTLLYKEFLHFLHFYISLQGIAFAVKAPRHRFLFL